jgi:hypothetical protein
MQRELTMHACTCSHAQELKRINMETMHTPGPASTYVASPTHPHKGPPIFRHVLAPQVCLYA